MGLRPVLCSRGIGGVEDNTIISLASFEYILRFEPNVWAFVCSLFLLFHLVILPVPFASYADSRSFLLLLSLSLTPLPSFCPALFSSLADPCKKLSHCNAAHPVVKPPTATCFMPAPALQIHGIKTQGTERQNERAVCAARRACRLSLLFSPSPSLLPRPQSRKNSLVRFALIRTPSTTTGWSNGDEGKQKQEQARKEHEIISTQHVHLGLVRYDYTTCVFLLASVIPQLCILWNASYRYFARQEPLVQLLPCFVHLLCISFLRSTDVTHSTSTFLTFIREVLTFAQQNARFFLSPRCF